MTDFILTFIVPSGLARSRSSPPISLAWIEAFQGRKAATSRDGMFLIMTSPATCSTR